MNCTPPLFGNRRIPFHPQVSSASVTDAPRPKLLGIKASLLIPGRGEPIKNGAIIIHDDIIEYAGAQSSIPAKFKAVSFTKVEVLMPGMWDCHVHYFGPPVSTSTHQENGLADFALKGARIAKSLEETLMAGFTSVREVGGFGGEVSHAVDEGTIVGPHIYSSIAPISMTGGHGDSHDVPLDVMLDACSHGLPMALCDGVPECIATVRKMIRRGAKVIKVCATGGVGSLLDDPEDVEFSFEELKAIVDEAARNQRVVAAHCHGKKGIINALNAGVKTIEHGSYLDDECVALMKEKDAILVSTRLIVEGSLHAPGFWDNNSYRKLVKLASAHKKAYALAVKAGVKIALGTDQSSTEPGTFNTHGMNGKELVYAVEAGLTPLQAIEACTATAPETVGDFIAPKTGQLKAGYDADIIALSENPLDDVSILTGQNYVTHVWKGGKLFKSP